MTKAQELFIKDLLNTITISKALKDSIETGLELDADSLSAISVSEASRLIKALIELDFDYLVKKYLEGGV